MEGNTVQWEKALEQEPIDVGSNPSPAPSQLCDLGEFTSASRSWPEKEEFGVGHVILRFLPARKLYDSI